MIQSQAMTKKDEIPEKENLWSVERLESLGQK